MATRIREIAPGKKGVSPSHTATSKLKGTPNHPSKTNKSAATLKLKGTSNQPSKTSESTASQKRSPGYLRPASRPKTTYVSKEQAKKPAATDTSHKPTYARTKSVEKTLSPVQRTRLSTNTSLRSSSFSGRTIDTQKTVPGKSLKTPTKDVGKQRILHPMPARNLKKTGTSIKKKDMEWSASETKEQIICCPDEKFECPSISSVAEPETQTQGQESDIAEAEEKTVQVVGYNEKATDDLVLEDQEPLDIEKTVAEINCIDANIVIYELPTALEHDIPLDIKTQDSQDKCCIEETRSKQQELEEHRMDVTSSENGGEISHEEAGEEEVKAVKEVAEEQETVLSEKDEADWGSEAHKSTEAAVQEVAMEKKQESENSAPRKQLGKKDSAVSNDVIEETASKLREQRKNKVKALAGAFETVISLRESK